VADWFNKELSINLWGGERSGSCLSERPKGLIAAGTVEIRRTTGIMIILGGASYEFARETINADAGKEKTIDASP